MRKALSLFLTIASSILITVPSLATGSSKIPVEKVNVSTFLFPINTLAEKGARTQLSFSPPKGFRCLQKENLLKGLNDLKMLEFIPEADNENSWSEIITSNVYVGKAVKANNLVSYIKKNIVEVSPEKRILEESTAQTNFFETATLTIAYTDKGRREVVRIKAFSGPADCISIQYAVALKEGQTEENAFKKIKLWMEDPQNLQIIKF